MKLSQNEICNICLKLDYLKSQNKVTEYWKLKNYLIDNRGY